MKIAAAQIEAKIGDLKGNLEKHLEMINIATQNEVDLIIFPEMSLTAYCREEGRELAVKESDEEIIQLQKQADVHNLAIVIGAPIEIGEDLYIGSYILKPNSKIEIYTKQYLHTGEELYYSSSFDYNPIIKIEDEIFVLAICADIDNPQHALDAKQQQCTVYLPSIFFSKNGLPNGHKLLSQYAKKHSFSVLMSNYCGELWDMESGGKSGFWDENGDLVAALASDVPDLLILTKEQNRWISQDEVEINKIVKQFFNLFTNTNNRIPELNGIKEIFLKDGLIIKNSAKEAAIYDLESFLKPRIKILTNGTLTNFVEYETSHKTDIYGNIAQRKCTYKKSGKLNGELYEGKGTKLMQFIKIKEKWFFSSVVWEDD